MGTLSERGIFVKGEVLGWGETYCGAGWFKGNGAAWLCDRRRIGLMARPFQNPYSIPVKHMRPPRGTQSFYKKQDDEKAMKSSRNPGKLKKALKKSTNLKVDK